MLKKTISSIIAVAIIIASLSVSVFADSNDAVKSQLDTKGNMVDTLKSCTSIDTRVINKEQKILSNTLDKSVSGTRSINITKSVLDRLSTKSTKKIVSNMDIATGVADQNNHDPNSAIYWGTYPGGAVGKVQCQGITSQEGQSDWYAFSLAQNQKITTNITYSAGKAQYYIQLYKFDASSSTINLVAGDPNKAVYNALAGVYYVRVVAASGFDNVNPFTLVNYASDADQYEVDDSVSTLGANSIKRGDFTQCGTIDNPYDTDIIKYLPRTNVSVILRFSMPSGASYSLNFFKENKTTGGIDYVGTVAGPVIRLTGMEVTSTYYFVVSSANGSFNNTSNYSLQIETQIPAQMSGHISNGDSGITSDGIIYYNKWFEVTGIVVDKYGYPVQNASIAGLLDEIPCGCYGNPSDANGNFIMRYYCNSLYTNNYTIYLRSYNPLESGSYAESAIGNINVYHP